MSFRASWLAALLLLACDPAPAPPADEPVDACAATAPVRLAAPPAGWWPDATHQYRFRLLRDRLFYTFDPPDLSERTYWKLARCGGAPERFTSLRGGDLRTLLAIDTEGGAVLYARDDADAYHLVDRLDVPGDDEPRPVAGLPPDLQGYAGGDYVMFTRFDTAGPILGAAGLGDVAFHYTIYTHAGDPDLPAVHLGGDIVDHARLDGRMLLLHEDGTLRDIDPRTGQGDPLLTGVRRFDLAYGDRRLIWQALGDDVAEPVHLLDLDTGEDREVAVNEFTARSWGRDIGQKASVGTWQFLLDDTAAVFVGPDQRLVAAVRSETGEPLPIPAHDAWQGTVSGDMLVLRLDDPEQFVLAAWTPLTGDLRVYYRGDLAVEPTVRFYDGRQLEYFLPDGSDFGSLVRVDLATGATVRLAPRLATYLQRLDDRRYVSAAVSDYISTAEGLYFSFDLDLFDPNTQVYWPIAAGIDDWALARDQGVFWLDVRGPEPGLWLYPLAGE